MQTLERLSEVPRIEDPVIRHWVAERWLGALQAGAEVRFLLLSPLDLPLQTVWPDCVGRDRSPPPSLEALTALFEYVVDHDAFYEILILANQDSGVIVVVPKSQALDAAWSASLQYVAQSAGNPFEPCSSASPRSAYVLPPLLTPTSSSLCASPGRSNPARCRDVGAASDPPAAGIGATEDGETAMILPLFALGRVVATPQALSVLDAHRISPLGLLQRHVRGDWGELCPEDAVANREALQVGARLLSSYPLGEGVTVWIITEADRSVTTVLMPDDY